MSIPTGTVTFLFTDIEGSTRLAREHSEKWEHLRARHHEILQAAIDGWNGYVFQVIGDAFCAAFHRPGDAVNAAILAQQGLQGESWGDTVIRVRMGVHTGEAEYDGKDYRGYLTMSLVQRLMSAGHGGQVLVSGAAENLMHGQSLGEVYLQDLGWHYFKDVPQPVRLFQVTASGLQKEFPPVRTIDHHPNNLPAQLTSFVGREKERAEIRRLLQNTHMLTLIGPGGTGKTRLSIQAASEMLDAYPDGVWLVELAPILDPLLVPRTTAITIGLRDEPQRPVIDMLCDYLHDRKMMILLDNCEHLVDACAHMADRLLHAAPGVVILASSREALGIGGEVTYRVPSLGLPDLANLPSVDTLDQYEAVRLFIDRATSADPSFAVTNQNAPAVAQICHRLDGIPLAIELAAAKIRVLGVDQIARRLDDRFKLLTGGSRTALERHQTLRAAIDWSYNLLPPAEQILFRRLSIFVDGWTLEAAESICSGETVTGDDVLDLLEHLIHKSLVFREEARYRMLETIRQYANEKLVESGESDVLRDRHLEYYLNLAETAEPYLIKPEQLEWLYLLDMDYENLRQALEWASNRESAEPSLRLCAALGRFWRDQNLWVEGSKWIARVLGRPAKLDQAAEVAARVRVLCWDADLAELLDDLERMQASCALGLSLALEYTDPHNIAMAMFYTGFSTFRRFDFGEARPILEQSLSLFQELNDPFWEAYTSSWLAATKLNGGEPGGMEYTLQTLSMARKAGDRFLLARVLSLYSELLFSHNRIEDARRYLHEAEELLQQEIVSQNRPHILIIIQIRLARLEWTVGNRQQARALILDSQAFFQLIGEKLTNSYCLMDLGLLSLEEGDIDRARKYFEEALLIAQDYDQPYSIGLFKAMLSIPLSIQGNIDQARQLIREGITIFRDFPPIIKRDFLLLLLLSPYLQGSENLVLILAAISRSGNEIDLPIAPLLNRYYIQAEAQAWSSLGDAAFETGFAEGQKLSLDDALDLALKAVEEMQ